MATLAFLFALIALILVVLIAVGIHTIPIWLPVGILALIVMVERAPLPIRR